MAEQPEIDLAHVTWRKSSHSNGNGECVEVADAVWRKSSYSNVNGECLEVADSAWCKSTHSNGNVECVEVADGVAAVVPVRDSKYPERAHLDFPPAAWSAFVAALRDVRPQP